MMRYINPQRIKSTERIKSVLNYMKRGVRGLAVNFRNKYYLEQFNSSYLGEEKVKVVKECLYSKTRALNYQFSKAEVEAYFAYMPKICQKIIDDTPYRSNP